MAYSFENIDQVVVFRPDSLLNVMENKQILEDVDEFLLDGKSRFIIDLVDLEFLNSSGMSLLIAIFTRSRNAGGDAVIVHVNDQVDKLLVMTKLKELLPVRSNLDAGQQFFEQPTNLLPK